MPIKRTDPRLGLPYLRAADTDIRKTFACIERIRLASLAVPLQAPFFEPKRVDAGDRMVTEAA